jgi:hypothetical protein
MTTRRVRIVRKAVFVVLAVVALGVGLVACATGASRQTTTTGGNPPTAASMKQVDYPETHPLVPGQFDNQHYPKYDEVISILKGWAAKYPGLVDVYTVGKTYEGRDIWQMTITNKSTGAAESKPAMYVAGNIHSEEVTACVAALDFANALLTGYGTDPEIAVLVDTRAFYVKPTENPDGSELFLTTAQANRSSVHRYDDDGDGLADEDPPEDLNGDGLITHMLQYVGPGKGDTVIVLDHFISYAGKGQGDYLAFSEGIDNDGDGKYNEDGVGGLDLNRNYPVNWRPAAEATGVGWAQGGSGSPGEYPLSEPETRASYLFFMTHPNISVIQGMHTSIPMYLHPPATSHPEESMFPVDSAYYDYLDSEATRLSGFIPAGDAYHDYPRYGGDVPMFGNGADLSYFALGAVGYGDELWGYLACMKSTDFNGDGVFDYSDVVYMNENVPEYKGKLIVDWTPYDHPTLGKVLIGGLNQKFWVCNPPAGELLAQVVAKETEFNLLLAKSLPLVAASNPVVTANRGGTHTLTVTITNEGFLPDALRRAYLVKIVKPGQATIKLDWAMSVTPSTSATQGISFFAGTLPDNDTTFEALSNMTWARSRQVSWVIRGSGSVTVTVRSTRGGTSTVTVDIP